MSIKNRPRVTQWSNGYSASLQSKDPSSVPGSAEYIETFLKGTTKNPLLTRVPFETIFK